MHLVDAKLKASHLAFHPWDDVCGVFVCDEV